MFRTVNILVEVILRNFVFRIRSVVRFISVIDIHEDSGQLIVIRIGETEFQVGGAEDQPFQRLFLVLTDRRHADRDQITTCGSDFTFQIVLGFQTFPDRFNGVVAELIKVFFRIFALGRQFQHEFRTAVQVDPQVQGAGGTLTDQGKYIRIGPDFIVFYNIFRQKFFQIHSGCCFIKCLGGVGVFFRICFLFFFCRIDQGNEFRIIGILGHGAEGVVEVRLGHGEHAPDKDRHHRYREEGSEEDGSFHFWAASMVVVTGSTEAIAALLISILVLAAIVITKLSSFTS